MESGFRSRHPGRGMYLEFGYSRGFIASVQVKEDNWEAVVAILMASVEQLPNELLSQAAMKFLPALNEVCHPGGPR
jgi:hypothetical protein